MFLRYNTVDDADARDAMERLSSFLEEGEGARKKWKKCGTWRESRHRIKRRVSLICETP